MKDKNELSNKKELEIIELLGFLEGEISWLAERVNSFPHGKLSPEENRRVNVARRLISVLAESLK